MADIRLETAIHRLTEAPAASAAPTADVTCSELTPPVPFFSRLGVKHGAVLIALALLAMTLISVLQLRETLYEIQRAASGKARGVAESIAPLVVSVFQRGDPQMLGPYFTAVATRNEDIDYIQVVDSTGRALASNDYTEESHQPFELHPGWLIDIDADGRLDARGADMPWQDAAGGIDLFVPLVEAPETATREDLLAARHLRVGINFDRLIQKDIPRVIRQMIVFTLIVTAVMVIGLVLLLKHVLRPLRDLQRGLKAVANGNLNHQVPVRVRDEMGLVLLAFNNTIARLRSAFGQIEALATRDPLTDLPNRRFFDERLELEAARSRRYGHFFGVLMLDLDKFKSINDTYGHPAGDEVLKATARVIERNVRETDLPARIGGEEFAIILPETSAAEILSVAEKLRAAIESMELPARNGLPPGVRVTISAGAACVGGSEATPEDGIAFADAALYASKKNGRNRVTMISERERRKTDSGIEIPLIDGADGAAPTLKVSDE